MQWLYDLAVPPRGAARETSGQALRRALLLWLVVMSFSIGVTFGGAMLFFFLFVWSPNA